VAIEKYYKFVSPPDQLFFPRLEFLQCPSGLIETKESEIGFSME
jgi:hypothetical protein